MRKGESVRIELKEACDDGIIVHSYKRKTDIFVDIDNLKANYSKDKYKKRK